MNWASIGSFLKQAAPWATIAAPAIGGLIAGRGKNQNAAQVNQGNAIGSQVDWYGEAIPGMMRDEQAAMNSAMNNYDPYGDYESGNKMLGLGDLYRGRDAAIRETSSLGPSWLPSYGKNRTWMPQASPELMSRLSTGALSNLQADKESNLIEQSQGAFTPSNYASAWGTSDQTTALQNALAKQREATLAKWGGKRNDYINQMNKGYQGATQWASGRVNT